MTPKRFTDTASSRQTNHHGARTHVLLLADHSGYAFVPIVGEGLLRVLQKSW